MEHRPAAHGQPVASNGIAAEEEDEGVIPLDSVAAADREIADLEARLREARARRAAAAAAAAADGGSPGLDAGLRQQHFLLLLSDSALPLGSFAFSSGLESFLAHVKHGAHHPPLRHGQAPLRGADAFAHGFLPLSVSSYAGTGLPFVLAAHDAATAPSSALADCLADLDDTFDATIICTVGRRASVAQGRALLSVWERSLSPKAQAVGTTATVEDPLRPFAQLVKRSAIPTNTAAGDPLPPASAHLPPLFGAVAGLVGLDRHQTAHVFVLAHVKALASAAVRASLVGPYQAQKLLASAHVQHLVAAAVARAWTVPVEDAGQTAPVVDLWMGRHEMLYSRIFNS